MSYQPDSTPKSTSSNSLDIATLKQRRYQYKAFRQNFFGNNSDAGSDLAGPSLQGKQDFPASERSYSPISSARNGNLNIPLKEKETSSFHQQRITSEPNEALKFVSTPKGNHSPSKTLHDLSPTRNAFYKTHTHLTPRASDSLNPSDWLETMENEISNLQTMKQAPMTPESKRYNTPSIFQKDLQNYRAARQSAKVTNDHLENFRNRTQDSGSRSLDPYRVNSNQTMDSDFARTLDNNERKGFLFEHFYKRNNLEVLEEDESPSDELEVRKNSKAMKYSLDQHVRRKDKPNPMHDLLKSTIKKRTNPLLKTPERPTSYKVEPLFDKNVLTKTEQTSSTTAMPTTSASTTAKKSASDSFKNSFKALKAELHKGTRDNSETKAIPVSGKDSKRALTDVTAIEEPQKLRAQKVISEEQPNFSTPFTPDKTKTIQIPGSPGMTESQSGTSLNSSVKKLQLNNINKPLPYTITSNAGSVKTSPKGRPKAASNATVANKPNPSLIGTPKSIKTIENKTSYASIKKPSTYNLTSVPSGGSTAYTASIGDTETHQSETVVTKAGSIVNTETNEGSSSNGESFFKTWTPGSYAANKAKKLEMGVLKTLLQKEKQQQHEVVNTVAGGAESCESERANSQKPNKNNNERDSSLGKQATANINIKETIPAEVKKGGIAEAALTYDHYGFKSANNKNDPISYKKNSIDHSANLKSLKSSQLIEQKAQPKETNKERSKDKTPQRAPRKNSGASTVLVSGLDADATKKGNDVNSATLKPKSSYSNQFIKSIKIVDVTLKEQKEVLLHEKKSFTLQAKDLKEMQLPKKNAKEIRSSKHSRDWRNPSELKIVNVVEVPAEKSLSNLDIAFNAKSSIQQISNEEPELGATSPHQQPHQTPTKKTVEHKSSAAAKESHEKKHKGSSTTTKKEEKGKHHHITKKYEAKSEAITPVKSNSRLKNITIPSTVLKTLGLGLNSRNPKSTLVTGEKAKAK